MCEQSKANARALEAFLEDRWFEKLRLVLKQIDQAHKEIMKCAESCGGDEFRTRASASQESFSKANAELEHLWDVVGEKLGITF